MTPFHVGKSLPHRARNVLVLHVNSMSGDADAYHDSTQDFPNTPEGQAKLLERLRIIRAAARVSSGAEEHEVDGAIRAHVASSATCAVSADSAVDWYMSMVGSDATCEGRSALLRRAWITFIDEGGVEYEVWVDLDGEEVSTYGISPRG